jgi:uncharacterized protein (DUF433 family)
MDHTVELVTETVGGEVYAYYPLGEYIVRAPGVCGGRPTFKYARIEVAGVLELLTAGDTIDQIVAGYRGRVSQRAIEEALHLAKEGLLTTDSTPERV